MKTLIRLVTVICLFSTLTACYPLFGHGGHGRHRLAEQAR